MPSRTPHAARRSRATSSDYSVDIPALRAEPEPPRIVALLSVRLPAYTLILFFGLLQLFYLTHNGLWEGEETARANIARALHAGTLHWFAPLQDGALLPVPWLDLLLLKIAGPSELFLHLPQLAFCILGLVVLANVAAQHFGRWVAAFAVTLAAGTPALVFGAAALHGHGATTAIIGVACLSVAHYSAAPPDRPIARGIVLGVLFGLSFFAWGALGAAIPAAMGLLLSWTRGMVAAPISTLLVSVLISALIAMIPMLPLVLAAGPDLSMPYILWPPLAEQGAVFASPAAGAEGLLQHRSFDRILRILAFSTFPLIALLPFSLAWLSSRVKDEEYDIHSPQTMLVLALLSGCAVCLVLVGLANAAVPTTVVPLVHMLALLVAIALGGSWRRSLSRSASYLTLLSSVVLLALMTKDLRGNYSADEGRPGPYALLETLLHTDADFWAAFTFSGIAIAPLGIALLLIIGYGDAPSRLRDLQRLIEAREDAGPRWSRVHRALEWLRQRTRAIVQRVSVTRIALGIALLVLLQGVLLLQRALPAYTTYASDKALAVTLHTLRVDDEAVLTLADNDLSGFYFQAIQAAAVADNQALAQRFCADDARVFALLTPAQATRFVSWVRRQRGTAGSPCKNDAEAIVLFDGSHRFYLLSNTRNAAAGEARAEQFYALLPPSRDALPDDLIPGDAPWVVGGTLAYLGGRITPAHVGLRGTVRIETYWEVRRAPYRDWEMLTHLDTTGARIHANHAPIEGRFALHHLSVGDIFMDAQEVPLRLRHRSGRYEVFVGFTHDGHRFEVEPTTAHDRIRVGELVLRRAR